MAHMSDRQDIGYENEQDSGVEQNRLSIVARKVSALLDLHQDARAAKELQAVCKTLHLPDEEQRSEIQMLLGRLSAEWQAQYWAQQIGKAEAPNPLSSRDGKLLRKIPLEAQLGPAELTGSLSRVVQTRLHRDSPSLLFDAWSQGKAPGKAAVSLTRAYAYLQAGKFSQALKDARTAAAYGPQEGGRCCWSRALAAISSATEGLQEDNTRAALNMQKALELDSGSEEYGGDLERLLRRIPEEHARALQTGGSDALEALLAAEAEEALPEFRRSRPKYYYYYKWMRERVTQQCGPLPPPVLEKVVQIDATELDMLLTYPTGIRQQAAKLLDVYNNGEGAAELDSYRLPLLSWKEVEVLKAEHASLAIAADASARRALPSVEEAAEDEEEDLDAIEPL